MCALGVDHYWVVDADASALTAFVREGSTYRADCTITDTAPELRCGVGTVRIDIGALTR